MRTVGQVEIERLDLAAKCRACGKSAIYERGETLMRWKMRLAEFTMNHKDCTVKSKGEA